MELGDNFPELPVPLNSRRVCLGFRDMDLQVNYKKVTWINGADGETLERLAERFVLSAKLLSGLSIEQLREAIGGTDVKIYWTMGDQS